MRVSVEGYGDMIFELFEDRVPNLTSRVVELASSGFYNDRLFYRVNSTLIQTGDEQNLGMGTSHHGTIDDQFHLELQHNRSGVLSMAKLVDDGNDSHFFVTSGPQRGFDFHHSIVGQLVEGEDVRQAIESVAKAIGGVPKFPIRISSVEIFTNTENGMLLLSSSDSVGTSTITVTATNAGGKSFQRQFQVSLAADNHNSQPFLPSATEVVAFSSLVAEAIAIPFSAIDREGNTVRYEVRPIGDIPFEARYDAGTGQILVIPPVGFTGRLELDLVAYSPESTDYVDHFDHELIVVNIIEF
jgi:cyclophilin family peptidyl-prolyl cis-trans isomerase